MERANHARAGGRAQALARICMEAADHESGDAVTVCREVLDACQTPEPYRSQLFTETREVIIKLSNPAA